MSDFTQIANAIQEGEIEEITGLVQAQLDAGATPQEILQCMIDTMGVVGDLFQKDEIFVPEMLVAATTMKAGVEVLQPLLAGDAVESPGTCIIGTVAGDLHDIGKNLVAMMIESAGFTVVDLGVDVTTEAFLQAIKDNADANIVALSALLTTTMPAMEATVTAIKDAGLDNQVKIMVGGAPITQAFADGINADGFSEDAASAANLAKRLAG